MSQDDDSKKPANQLFQLNLIQRQPSADPNAEKRRIDRENGRQAAQRFAEEALLETVAVMRTTTDPDQKLKAAKMIMDRAWGTPKAAETDQEVMKNRTILEIMANISSEITQVTYDMSQQQQKIEKTDINDAIEGLLLEEDPDDGESGQGEG